MNNSISKNNKLQEILDFDKCRKLVYDAIRKGNKNEYVILCPHYSINIASKFNEMPTPDYLIEQGSDMSEQLNWDLDELSGYIGYMVEVSDYDDLVVNLSEGED